MNFELNPYNSIKKINSLSNYNINTLNDDCYSICSSFGDAYDYEVQKKCDSTCKDIITKKKYNMNKNDCTLRRPPPPPIWKQTPAYFPKFLSEYNDKEKAYNMCIDNCQYNTTLQNSCKKKCEIDSNAIIEVKNKESYLNKDNRDLQDGMKGSNKDNSDLQHGMKGSNKDNSDLQDGMKGSNKDNSDLQDGMKAHPFFFLLGFSISIIIMVILIIIFIRILYIEKL